MWDFNAANSLSNLLAGSYIDIDCTIRLRICNYQDSYICLFSLYRGMRMIGLRFVHEEVFATRGGPERTSRPREVGKAHFDGPLCHQAIPFEIRRRRELCYRGVWADQRQIPGWDAYVRNWYAWWGFPSRIVNYHNLVAGSESER